MFRTITEEPPKRPGKYAGQTSVHEKANHYTNEGYTDNEFIGAKSSNLRSFKNHGVVPRV